MLQHKQTDGWSRNTLKKHQGALGRRACRYQKAVVTKTLTLVASTLLKVEQQVNQRTAFATTIDSIQAGAIRQSTNLWARRTHT